MLSPAIMTVWSPVVRVVGVKAQLPLVSAVMVYWVPSILIETLLLAAAVPLSRGLVLVKYQSVPGLPLVVAEEPMLSSVRAQVGWAKTNKEISRKEQI